MIIYNRMERLEILDKDLNKLEIDDKKILKAWKEYKLHIVVLLLVIIAETIGSKTIPITSSVTIVIMPLLYSMSLGLVLYLFKPFTPLQDKQATVAEEIVLIAIGPLIAKLALSSGQSIITIIQAGPALLLQELGNLGTIFFALPIALLLGFKRETIGMTSSICRESNIGVIIDKYGFQSPETRGYFIVYLIGTMIGTIFISILASVLISVLPLHPYAFAMASGIGSGSMNAAALAPLLKTFPSMARDIQAFSGISNLLSMCSGIYVYILIALPLTEKLYSIFEPKLGRITNKNPEESITTLDDENEGIDHSSSKKAPLNKNLVFNWGIILLIFAFMGAIGNYVGYGHSIISGLIGMLILSGLTFIGLVIEEIIPYNIPAVVYISIVGFILAIPGMPTADFLINYTNQIELLTIVTVILAYSGIAMGKSWEEFKKIGWRGVIVTLFVIFGTYFCSALIANLTLSVTGII